MDLAALILPSRPKGAPQRTRSTLDLAKGSVGAKATVGRGVTLPRGRPPAARFAISKLHVRVIKHDSDQQASQHAASLCPGC